MTIDDRSRPLDVRNPEAGMLLLAAAAILLFVSLFLEWYQPAVDAWTIFEGWDLVLAVLAIVAFVAAASRMGFGPPRPGSWLLGPAIAALVIVLYAILDPPPATHGIDGDPGTGLWLALASALLMTAGAVLSVARISVAVTRADPTTDDRAAPGPGDRVGRGAAAATGAPGDRVGGGAVPPAGTPADRVGRGAVTPPPAPSNPAPRAVPPTERTRRG
jgi:hypothetical protein